MCVCVCVCVCVYVLGVAGSFTTPVSFPLITKKLYPWKFAAFSNILLETFLPNLVSLTHPSLQILSKTQTEVFPISGFWAHSRKLKIENYNSRTSDDIEMKLGPVTTLDKGNKGTSKNDYDVMPENCDIIVIFPIYGQFGVIWKLDSGRIACKTYIFIHSKLLS